MTTKFLVLLLLSNLLVTPSLGVIINNAPHTHTRSHQLGGGSTSTPPLRPHFEAIYQFGDSLSDTGNLIRQGNGGATSTYARPPYGRTFFHHPTGRCSDGLLMVDYFAIYFGLPLLNPYLAIGSDFSNGANFAVAGATALSPADLAARNIIAPVTSSSLDTQLAWFKTHLLSICYNPRECKRRLEKSLVIMGEIGGNDFNFAFTQGKSMQEAYALVPDVVQAIKHAVQEVINMGAMNVVVPGNFPIGCVPLYLVRFASFDRTMYDELGCLKQFNEFSMFYNSRLQDAISELQHEHPNVAIVYGDYFSALIWVITHSASLGFEKDGWHKACCADGNNPYNLDLSRRCGTPGVPVCPDPTKRLNWDGIHMTQQGNKFVANFLLREIGPQLHPPITRS